MDIRIAGKFRLGRKIGGGSFGDIYLGANPASARTCKTHTCPGQAVAGPCGLVAGSAA